MKRRIEADEPCARAYCCCCASGKRSKPIFFWFLVVARYNYFLRCVVHEICGGSLRGTCSLEERKPYFLHRGVFLFLFVLGKDAVTLGGLSRGYRYLQGMVYSLLPIFIF